eukprot:357217-Chlamydomonas_euryale.AAC.4
MPLRSISSRYFLRLSKASCIHRRRCLRRKHCSETCPIRASHSPATTPCAIGPVLPCIYLDLQRPVGRKVGLALLRALPAVVLFIARGHLAARTQMRQRAAAAAAATVAAAAAGRLHGAGGSAGGCHNRQGPPLLRRPLTSATAAWSVCRSKRCSDARDSDSATPLMNALFPPARQDHVGYSCNGARVHTSGCQRGTAYTHASEWHDRMRTFHSQRCTSAARREIRAAPQCATAGLRSDARRRGGRLDAEYGVVGSARLGERPS